MTEAQQDYEKLFSLMVKKFDLHKKQTTTDSLIKKGEINAISRMNKIIETQIVAMYIGKESIKKSFKNKETSMKKFDIKEFGPKYAKELYSALAYSEVTLTKNKSELVQYRALEHLFEVLDLNFEESLGELDLLNTIKESQGKYSKDVEIRIKSGKCAFKRPGRVKFPCDCEIVEGEQYCAEHLQRFNPDRYYEIFEEEE